MVFGLRQAQASEEALALTPAGQRKAMKDAVLVFGATGKLGREIVAQVRVALIWLESCSRAAMRQDVLQHGTASLAGLSGSKTDTGRQRQSCHS